MRLTSGLTCLSLTIFMCPAWVYADYQILWGIQGHTVGLESNPLGDIDGDGRLELVRWHYGPNQLEIVDALTGVVEFSAATTVGFQAVLVTDLDGDPNPEVIVQFLGDYSLWVIDFQAAGSSSGDLGDLPNQISAISALPNPSAGASTIRFALGSPGEVEVIVFDVAGRLVRRVFQGPLFSGPQELVWDGLDGTGRRPAAGAYFYRVNLEGKPLGSERIILAP